MLGPTASQKKKVVGLQNRGALVVVEIELLGIVTAKVANKVYRQNAAPMKQGNKSGTECQKPCEYT